MNITNANWPHTQSQTCAGCKTTAQLEERDALCTVTTAGNISASYKCPGCGAALTLTSTKTLITGMNIPVVLQSPAIKALLAGKAYSDSPPKVVSSSA